MDAKKIIETGKKVIRIEKEAVAAAETRIGGDFAKAVELIIQSSGRVVVTGMGKSGAIGKKIASTLASTGTTASFMHPAEGIHGDLGMILKTDVVVAISKSGETDELIHLLPSFKRLEVPLIAMTGNKNSTLARYSSAVLDISVKEEACPNDLAPTASTTVTLAVGDALAVALLESRGFSAEDFAMLHPGGALGKKLLMRVMDIMESGELLPACRPSDPMRVAILEMAHKRGICPVIDENRSLLGVLTTGDLNRLIEKTENFSSIPAGDIMNREPKFVYEEDLASIAYREMEKYRIISMPVLNKENKLSGVLHLHDLMREGISG